MRSTLLIVLMTLATVFVYAQSDKKQEKLKKKILKETREGGKYDFFTPIKGREYEGVEVKPQVFSTQLGMAIYKWGEAVYELGVADVETAYAIFAEFKGRNLNEIDKAYIKMGFDRELSK